MPFGIRSALEVFQRKTHELIEGLRGVEVIADDFVVAGSGESWQSAIKDHDRNLLSFLQRCDECGVHFVNSVRLSPEKVKCLQILTFSTVKLPSQHSLGSLQATTMATATKKSLKK